MINVVLTVAEVVSLLRSTNDDHLVDRLKFALEGAIKPETVEVTITGFSESKGIIPAIKVLRKWFGWSLREAKDFCDDIRGPWVTYYYTTDGTRDGIPCGDARGGYRGGTPGKVTVHGHHDAARFMSELGAVGAFFTVK